MKTPRGGTNPQALKAALVYIDRQRNAYFDIDDERRQCCAFRQGSIYRHQCTQTHVAALHGVSPAQLCRAIPLAEVMQGLEAM